MLSMRETAEYLGVPVSSVQTHWKRWGLRGYRVGKRVQFRERDLESWLEKQVIPVVRSVAS